MELCTETVCIGTTRTTNSYILQLGLQLRVKRPAYDFCQMHAGALALPTILEEKKNTLQECRS
jgi:hypothetical protein